MGFLHCSARKRALVVFGAVAAILLSIAATAWACVPFASLRVTPTEVEPGQEVTVTGAQFSIYTPITIHLDALDGRELATVMADSPKGPFFSVTFMIPPDVTPGSHLLVATQQPPNWGAPTWGVPARTLITVGHPATAAPAQAQAHVPRSANLGRDSVGPAAFILVTLGAAAVALLGFGGVAAIAARRAGARNRATVSS